MNATATAGAPGGAATFSLVRGGPTYALARRLRPGHRWPELRMGLGLAFLTWAPLLILSALESLLLEGDARVPFLSSLGTHARFLVAIPLLCLAEAWIDPQLAGFVGQIVDSKLVPASKRAALDRAVQSAARWRDSTLAEAVILGLAVVLVAAGIRTELPADVSTWRATSAAGPHTTWAGWWFTAFALPVFQFLVCRWFWRIAIWWVFLWRLSRMDLDLVPIHPDRSGGLGYLGVAQSYFSTLSFAFSTVFAGNFAENLLFAGGQLLSIRWPVVGIVVLNLVIFLGPLLFFSPQLVAVKREGLREYGVLAARYTRGFHDKWLRGGAPADEPLLGSADIQSLADLAGSVEIIQSMRVVSFPLTTLVSFVAATLAPLLPLLLVAFSVDELVLHAAKLLFGL